MKYTIVSANEYTYLDRFAYISSSPSASVSAVRGSYACFQVLVREPVSVQAEPRFEGLPDFLRPEFYSLIPVPVECNEEIQPADFKPHYPERVAPYQIYDCLKPWDGQFTMTDGQGGIYVSVFVPKDAVPGAYSGVMRIQDIQIPVRVEVLKTVLPDETLVMNNWFYSGSVCSAHHVEANSPEYFALEKQYLSLLRRMHNNAMLINSVPYKRIDEQHFEFNFEPFIEQVHRFEAAGMRYFRMSSIGWRKNWNEPTIYVGGVPCLTREGYCYLSGFAEGLRRVLRENHWENKFFLSVADEPNETNKAEYIALCGILHRLLPEVKLGEALCEPGLFGVLDIYCPVNSVYDRHPDEFVLNRRDGADIWFYVCNEPRDGYINRHMDDPLLSARFLHWGNYAYGLTGYLHWAVNAYQPGQDPFRQSCYETESAGKMFYLPAGDMHIVYPGDNGPWMSIRMEAERAGAEDYELLKLLSKANKPLADEICASVFRSFKDVTYDVRAFEAAHVRLLRAMEAMQNA